MDLPAFKMVAWKRFVEITVIILLMAKIAIAAPFVLVAYIVEICKTGYKGGKVLYSKFNDNYEKYL